MVVVLITSVVKAWNLTGSINIYMYAEAMVVQAQIQDKHLSFAFCGSLGHQTSGIFDPRERDYKMVM
jgi:hypothetical protein